MPVSNSMAIALADASHWKRVRVESALALLQARQAYAEYQVRQKDVVGADSAYVELLQDAQKLENDHNRPDPFARFVGEADGQIGDRPITTARAPRTRLRLRLNGG
jgi:hypothetical protein